MASSRWTSTTAVRKLSQVGVLGSHTTVISMKSLGERKAMLTIYSRGYRIINAMASRNSQRSRLPTHFPA